MMLVRWNLLPLLVAVPSAAAAQQLTLERAIAEAEAHAPALEIADAERDAAAGRIDQARSAGLPQAELTETIGVGRLDPGGFFGLAAADVTPRAAQVDVGSSALVELAASAQRDAGQEPVRNARDEVLVGQRPAIDLLDAEREATAAGVLALKAHADRVTAAYRLNALFGRD